MPILDPVTRAADHRANERLLTFGRNGTLDRGRTIPTRPTTAVLPSSGVIGRLLRREGGDSLDRILADAVGTSLADFTVELGRDRTAVQAALDTPWTTSPAEGQINRVKAIKRSMYGRAGFRLLRARVLHAA